MMSETGRVVALEGDSAWVETERAGSCGSCSARSGCGHGLLASIGSRPEVVRALLTSVSPTGLALHDTVRISLPEDRFLRGVALLYGLPLTAMLLGAVLAQLFWVTPGMAAAAVDVRVFAASVLGLLLGLSVLRLYNRRDQRDPSLQPVVTARLGAAGSDCQQVKGTTN